LTVNLARRNPFFAYGFGSLLAPLLPAGRSYVQDLAPTTAVIRAQVDPPAAARLSVQSSKGSLEGQSSDARGLHAFSLTGLSPKTTYTYRVTAGDARIDEGNFTTAPDDHSHEPFTFLVYGDNRTDDTAHAAVVRAMGAVPSDFLVHTGDFVQNGSNDAEWRRFFDIEGSLLRSRCVFSAIGNHELLEQSGEHFLRYFGPVEAGRDGGTARARLFRSVRWGNARILFLNGMDTFLSGDEREWLSAELGRLDGEEGIVWRIVVVHYGPWSSGPHGNNARLWNAELPAAFKRHKIDLVLSGHDHIYERGDAEGLLYVVSGGGGAPLYAVHDRLASTRTAESVHHFVEATVSDQAVKMVVHRADGSILERCGFEKGGGWDCDRREPAPVAVTPVAPPGSKNPSIASSRCACSLPGQARGGAGGALSLLGACALWMSRRRFRRR